MEAFLEIVFTIVIFGIVIWILVEKFKSHPSDKYYNDSWKNRK